MHRYVSPPRQAFGRRVVPSRHRREPVCGPPLLLAPSERLLCLIHLSLAVSELEGRDLRLYEVLLRLGPGFGRVTVPVLLDVVTDLLHLVLAVGGERRGRVQHEQRSEETDEPGLPRDHRMPLPRFIHGSSVTCSRRFAARRCDRNVRNGDWTD